MGSMTSSASQTAETGKENGPKSDPNFDFDPQSYDCELPALRPVTKLTNSLLLRDAMCACYPCSRIGPQVRGFDVPRCTSAGESRQLIRRRLADSQDYSRHCVKDEDYPGLIDKEQTHTLAPKNE